MAEKKMSQAEKTAAKAKSTPKKESKKAAPEPAPEKSAGLLQPQYILAVACLVLSVMFLLVALKQDGIVLVFLANVFKGLFGMVTFYAAIPGLAFEFYILTFGHKKRMLMRSICMMVCLFLTGCIAHMCYPEVELAGGFESIVTMYLGGIDGTTGGVVCGMIAMALQAAFGWVMTFMGLILGAVLCLMAVFQITIPGIYRAIRDRSGGDDDDWDEQEPAVVLVNRIAERRDEMAERKRLMDAERASLEAELAEKERSRPFRAMDIIRQISQGFETTGAEPVDAEVIPALVEEPVRVTPEKAEVTAEVAVETDQPAAGEGFPPVVDIPEKKKVTAKDAAISAQEVAAEIAMSSAAEMPAYNFPPLELLRRPRGNSADGTAEMRENTRRLNETLASFKIEAHISNVTRGPSVTRYEVELEKGVRLNKLTSAADDIALSLGASGVRIAPVPGKISVVGIEVPNQAVTTVSLREVIDSQEFRRAKSKSSFAVGKDIGGTCIVGNIAKLPHMLIAGTTGSGKSVCMNSIIISLLYKASPNDVKLIMVDPKMVELGIYNGIPHLLIPVVTDPKKAAGSLQWAVTEMMRRYRSMSDAGVRDLESYNAMIDEGFLEGEHLPQIVVIIDELADLMLVAAKEVEESICRIAQMGRAAGVHLIIATQRPSADVITGLMKANIPSRIAFAVASAMESRIILDNTGAEKLVGKGDMLYAPIGSGKPQRIQGCFVSDAEVEAVAAYVKEHFTSTYDQNVIEEIDRKAEQTGTKSSGPITASDPEPSADELAGDEMLPAAVEVILETKQASVSMLQRRLKLGYARAARIVDEMEEMGIVGPFQGSKPRQILITKEQWEQMKNGQTAIPEESIDEDPDDAVPDILL